MALLNILNIRYIITRTYSVSKEKENIYLFLNFTNSKRYFRITTFSPLATTFILLWTTRIIDISTIIGNIPIKTKFVMTTFISCSTFCPGQDPIGFAFPFALTLRTYVYWWGFFPCPFF